MPDDQPRLDVEAGSSERRDYVVSSSSSDPALGAVCEAVYDVLQGSTAIAYVDAYSDVADRMPDDIKVAEQWLRERGAEAGHRDPGMGIKTYPTEPTAWALTRAYTPWSIHTELFDAANKKIATFHDCGWSIVVFLTAEQLHALTTTLPHHHRVRPLIDATGSRRDHERRDGLGVGRRRTLLHRIRRR